MGTTTLSRDEWLRLDVDALRQVRFQRGARTTSLEIVGLDPLGSLTTLSMHYQCVEVRQLDWVRRYNTAQLLPQAIQDFYLFGWQKHMPNNQAVKNFDCHRAAMCFVADWRMVVEMDHEFLFHSWNLVEVSDLQFGDLVQWAEQGAIIHHTAVYVASGLVWSKNGRGARRPFCLQPFGQIAAQYGRSGREIITRRVVV